MEVLKLLAAFIKFFLPPVAGEPETRWVAWRYKVASSLASLVVCFAFAVLLALGEFPAVTKGFAMVETVQQDEVKITTRVDQNQATIAQLQEAVKDIRAAQLDTRLYDTRGRQCSAILMKNEAALRSEGDRLREDLPKYRFLTGEDWRVPPCNEY